jgi:hypothetical protein
MPCHTFADRHLTTFTLSPDEIREDAVTVTRNISFHPGQHFNFNLNRWVRPQPRCQTSKTIKLVNYLFAKIPLSIFTSVISRIVGIRRCASLGVLSPISCSRRRPTTDSTERVVRWPQLCSAPCLVQSSRLIARKKSRIRARVLAERA